MMIIYALLPLLKRVIASLWLFVSLLVLGGICTIVFIANLFWNFEAQVFLTFRLWNWLFYFLLGACVCKNPQWFKGIKWPYIVPAALLYIILFKQTGLYGNNLYYPSVLCIVFSLAVFVSILHVQIQGNKLIRLLSDTFLIVYTFHAFVGLALCKSGIFDVLEQTVPTSLAYCVELAATILASFAFGIVLMRIPLMNKIFRI